jgi:hypothetical protein
MKAHLSGVVSLCDLMLRFRLDYFSLFMLTFQIVEKDCKYLEQLDMPCHEEVLAALSKMAKGLNISMNHMDADKPLVAQIDALIKLLDEKKENRPSVIEAHLSQIMLGVDITLRNRLFMFIPEEHAKYYLNVEQFGGAVAMFPSALTDMLECASCYAADRPTACVFHSMRVAEHGLRHIANELSVEVSDGKKPCPIEFATWEKVIVEIENKRAALRKEQKSEDHHKRTLEYASLADMCSRIKDLWRNDTMHSRGIYSMPEAFIAMSRIAEFMNIVAGSEYAPPVDPSVSEIIEYVKQLTKSSREVSE